jgi:hypothetical protein
MPKPMTSETDAITGETIVREFTAAELEQREADLLQIAEKKAAIEAEKTAKAIAKAALLERLGMTAEEAALLLK